MKQAVQKQPISRPTAGDASLAARAGRDLAGVLRQTRGGALTVEAQGQAIALPAEAVRALLDVLNHMARGDAVAVAAAKPELTTKQAADLLGVSRTYLVQLLDEGALPYRKVGTHRRVRSEDVATYRRKMDRRQALDELTAYDQELGLQ